MKMPRPQASDTIQPVTDFGFGIMDRSAPTQIPPGAALYSFDADYDARNIGNRRGYERIHENGPGAIMIADFEADEVWTNATAEAVHFVPIEAAADGVRAARWTVAAAGFGEIVQTLGAPVDLGGDQAEVFNLWVKPILMPTKGIAYKLEIRFETTANDHYTATLAVNTDERNTLELNLSKYHRIRRQDFAYIGNPIWSNITKIRIMLTNTSTVGSLTVVVDNLHRTPGLIQDLFQFRRQSVDFSKASNEYAVARGILYKSDGKRWVQVYAGFDPNVPVHSITTQDRQLITDGKTTAQVLMADGTTVYRLGVLPPPRTITAAEISGGELSTGTELFVQVLFYSSKTDTFSKPDDRDTAVSLITIVGPDAGVRFSNIPVSADPQVDWVVIGIRPDTEPEVFFRATDGAFGDVPNGTTTLDFLDSVTTLRSRLATSIDPDMDHPSYTDPATKAQKEAHPLFFHAVGGYVTAVMAEQPTVVRWSRVRHPGSWGLEDEFPMGESDSEPLTGIISSLTNVFAHKRTAVYHGHVVGGDEGIRFETQVGERGAVDQKSMVVVNGEIFYRGQDGAYQIDVGLVPAIITPLAQGTWDKTWSQSAEGWGCAVVDRSRHQILHFSRRQGSIRNDAAWVTHYRTEKMKGNRGRWPEWAPTIHRLPADVAADVKSLSGGWESWIGGMGQVWRMSHGFQDDDRPIETIHRTALWSKDPRAVHQWRDLQFEGNCTGNFDLEVRAFLGTAIAQDGPTVLADLQGNADVLGAFVLAGDILGKPQYVADTVKLGTKIARYLSVELRFFGRGQLEVYALSYRSLPVGTRRTRL